MYQLISMQEVDADIKEVWDFFADPQNLSVITPPRMKMLYTGEQSIKTLVNEGTELHYTVSPFPLVTIQWTALITQVTPGRRFVDIQKKGPFKHWEHQHIFTPTKRGTKIQDVLRYTLPFGIIGKLFHPIIVQHKLKDLFAFRYQKANEIFGSI